MKTPRRVSHARRSSSDGVKLYQVAQALQPLHVNALSTGCATKLALLALLFTSLRLSKFPLHSALARCAGPQHCALHSVLGHALACIIAHTTEVNGQLYIQWSRINVRQAMRALAASLCEYPTAATAASSASVTANAAHSACACVSLTMASLVDVPPRR